jgi:hypothetical protein
MLSRCRGRIIGFVLQNLILRCGWGMRRVALAQGWGGENSVESVGFCCVCCVLWRATPPTLLIPVLKVKSSEKAPSGKGTVEPIGDKGAKSA